MADRLDAVLDHVAIAVPAWHAAEARWREQLGAGRSSQGQNSAFGSRQLIFAGGGKLELLTPPGDGPADNFVQRFLDRFGSTVHHVTLKVPDLHAALDVVASAGLEAVDVRDETEYWKEAFLRPSQVGGLVVQLAQTPYDDDTWAKLTSFQREQPRPAAVELLGPVLRHPDLAQAAAVWSVLGAEVTTTEQGLRCAWPRSPLDVVVLAGEGAGPVGLRMRGGSDLPADPALGPAVTAE
jgi:methylmalonyl-CoA/ethylmalonyl-CoA epimerase